MRWNNALILWHTELAQVVYTLQFPGHWKSRLIGQIHSTTDPPKEQHGITDIIFIKKTCDNTV